MEWKLLLLVNKCKVKNNQPTKNATLCNQIRFICLFFSFSSLPKVTKVGMPTKYSPYNNK